MAAILFKDINSQIIKEKPDDELEIVVTIPCYREENISKALKSLFLAWKEELVVEIIILINESENSDEPTKTINQNSYKACIRFKSKYEAQKFRIHPIYIKNIPLKIAGVGMARKIAMDEAILRLEWTHNKKGIITGFDADTLCEENYFTKIREHFEKFTNSPGATIHYEHPLEGVEYPKEIYRAICDYELHLRYFIQFQKWLGLPYAFQTIGSAMAVRSDAYRKIGGMNRRKAGEDFYFIHKLVKLGGFTELNSTRVIPSPRTSSRVPFGTGKAVQALLTQNKEAMSYSIQSFMDLKALIDFVPKIMASNEKKMDEEIQNFPPAIKAYLQHINAKKSIISIKNNSSTNQSFIKKFYQWFDAFKLMKYLHYGRDHFYPDETLQKICTWYFPEIIKEKDPVIPVKRLQRLREIDRLSVFNFNEGQI